MTCRYCGTALPDGALFCGECGQPVAAGSTTGTDADRSVIVPVARSASGSHSMPTPTHVAGSTGFSIADLAFSSLGESSEPDDDDRELPDGSPLDGADEIGSAAHCPQCGEAMAEGDVFCGECGFVVRTVSAPAPADRETDAPDADETTEVEPLVADELDGDELDVDESDGDESDVDESDVDGADADAVDDLVRFGPPVVPHAPADDADGDLDLEFEGPLAFADPLAEPEPSAKSASSPRSRPIPDPFPWGTDQPLREDLEATRLVADSASGTRYVLQFSTGESVTVAGTGLVGRNPAMQPGEFVDQLVPIFDAGKSVSKTHLEFGQEAGRFWVSDRYSTNGSVIRQPDAEPRRCDAGRRYFIARGTRVDVGEQFFVVS